MNKIIFIVFLSVLSISIANSSLAQLKKNNFLLGISGAIEHDIDIATTSLNFEYETLQLNSGIIGLGVSAKYCNWTNSFDKNTYLTLNANFNFNKMLKGELVPFIGITGGTNFAASEPYYGAHVGIRYFIMDNVLLFAKYSSTYRSYVTSELGFDIKF